MSLKSKKLLLASVLLVQSTLTLSAAPPAGRGYQIVFQDEFTGTALDTRKWSPNYPWGTTHNHKANTQPSQVTVSGGYLNLKAEARRSTSTDGYWDGGFNKYITFDYTSGAVHTQGKFNFTRGYMEARIKMPTPQSTWPAFWMLGAGWPPEIDVMEVQGVRTRYFYNYHYGPDWTQHQSFGGQYNGVNLSAGFNTYGCEWTENEIAYYFNDVQVARYRQPGPLAQSKNMYLLLNLAVGGWAPDPVAAQYPATMQVDWVRIHQTTATPPPAFSGTYEIVNKKSSRLLEVIRTSTANGAKVQIGGDINGNHQRWTLTALGDGYYKIINVVSGRSLDVWNGGTGDGVLVSQYDYFANPQQQFRIELMDGGTYRIVPKHSGKCIAASAGGTTDGTAIIQWTWYGGDEQRWTLNKQ